MTKSGQSEPLFYETWQDAAREVVRVAGGTKRVGCQLWPAKPTNTATQRLTDCLNPTRDEKLSPDEFLMLCRIGRDAGCHVLNAFINNECGYSLPSPVNPEEKRAQLMSDFVQAVGVVRKIADELGIKDLT